MKNRGLKLLFKILWLALAMPACGAGYMEPGTLADHLSTNAVAHARGFSGSPDDLFALTGWHYAEYNKTNLNQLTNAVWSTNFWLKGVQGLSATCIGFSNGVGGQGLMTMVSPRHYLCATHMHPEAYLAAFLGTNNVIYWRKTLQRVDLTNDVSVGILDRDLPPSVGFLPVLPPNYTNYLSTKRLDFFQGIGMNQKMHLFGEPMTFYDPSLIYWNSRASAPSGLETKWNETLGAGDSSNPAMVLIENQLVLVSHNFGVQAGPNYVFQFNAINQQMRVLSKKNQAHDNYQLTPISLSKWTPITQ